MTLSLYHIHTIITAVVIVAAFVSFVREKIPAHMTALLAMAVLLLTGALTTHEALSVFSNSAPIAIVAMFIIGAALKETGVIDSLCHFVSAIAEKNYYLALIVFFGCVLVFSAFMNNTPIVVVMTPVVVILAKKSNQFPSKFLIPLSYVAIMGGTCTLIGTSTNLLVNGIATAEKLPAFNIFDVTLPGLLMAVVGMLFLATIGHRLLPKRQLLSPDALSTEENQHFLSSVMVLSESPFLGKTLAELALLSSDRCQLIDIVRGEQSLSRALSFEQTEKSAINLQNIDQSLRQIQLKAFDRLVIRAEKKELLDLHHQEGLSIGEHPALAALREAEETIVVEGMIGLHSRLINNKMSAAWIRRVYDCHILALYHRGKMIRGQLSETLLKFGHVLLIEGAPEKLEALFRNEALTSLTQLKKPRLGKKSMIALMTLLVVVILAAINFMPIAGIAMIGAVFLMITQCVSPRAAYEAIDWRMLMLIFGMLAVAIAMQKTGIALWLIHSAAGFAKDYGPLGLLMVVYIVTSLLTEMMTNNAGAVLVTPLVIGLTVKMGYDPTPFIVAIMFAASASFATPLGYQTNTYVYNAGNYKFKDFLKIGIPLNIINFAAAIVLIPIFWPLK